MGVFTRKDSPVFWLWLEPAHGEPGKKERTDIRADAPTSWQQKDNRKLAEQLYHVKMSERARRVIAPEAKPSISFANYAEWFRTHKLPQRKGRERDAGILDRLIPVFGAYPLKAITPKLVHELWITPRRTTPTTITKKRRTAARTIQAGNTTINREVDFLKAVLSSAVPEYFDQSPLYGMKRLPQIGPKRRLMSDEEEAKLLPVMQPDDRALFLIGLDALIRLTDILDLTWGDDHGQTLYVKDPKAGGGFAVALSTRARAALDAIKPDEPDAAAFIFTRRRRAATERDRRGGIQQALKRYCAAADIDYGRAKGGLTFHWATRRTGATRMLTRGADPGTVQKVGRWKKPDVVLGIYHELIDEAHRAAVESVGSRSRSVPDAPAKKRELA